MASEPNVFLDSFSYPDNSQASDTISVESSDSLETSFSACSPDNISRSEHRGLKYSRQSAAKLSELISMLSNSASMSNVAKIEEMERLLREAQVEKQRLLEHRVPSHAEAKLGV